MSSGLVDRPWGKEFCITIYSNDENVRHVVDSVFETLESIAGVSIPRSYDDLQWDDIRAKATKTNGKLDPDIIAENLRDDCYRVIVVDDDLQPEGLNFVFGSTIPEISPALGIRSYKRYEDDDDVSPSVIVSTARTRKNGSIDCSQLYLVLLHELGHFFGLPPLYDPFGDYNIQGFPANPNYILPSEDVPELDAHHCRNDYCAMSQTNIPGRMGLSEKPRMLHESHEHGLFCNTCQTALKANLRMLYGTEWYDAAARRLISGYLNSIKSGNHEEASRYISDFYTIYGKMDEIG